jgi:hypothetical protein
MLLSFKFRNFFLEGFVGSQPCSHGDLKRVLISGPDCNFFPPSFVTNGYTKYGFSEWKVIVNNFLCQQLGGCKAEVL